MCWTTKGIDGKFRSLRAISRPSAGDCLLRSIQVTQPPNHALQPTAASYACGSLVAALLGGG